MTASASAPWTPYGLEAYRVSLLRRRTLAIWLAVLLALAALGLVLLQSIRTGNDIFVHGGDGTTVKVEIPEQPRAKPITLRVAPGKTTVMDEPIESKPPPRAPSAPPTAPAKGLNWANLLLALAPPVLVALSAGRWAKKRVAGPLEQVNLGVYKGAMPLEMITAEQRKYVFNPRHAYASLFGKQRHDHVPARPTLVARRR